MMPSINAFVITLKGSGDPSVVELRMELERLNIPTRVISGIMGRDMTAGQYFSLTIECHKRHGYWMTPGEVGCALSHADALRAFLTGTADAALVLEDDADASGVALALPHLTAAAGFAFVDFIHLGGMDGLHWAQDALLGRKVPEHDGSLFEIDPASTWALQRTCGYIIKREAAAAILDALENCLFLADDFVIIRNLLPSGRIFFMDVVRHPSDLGGSLMESERKLRPPVAEGIPLARRLLAEVRKTIAFRRLRLDHQASIVRNNYERVFKEPELVSFIEANSEDRFT
jgi:glycosyl transferase, family 25